MSGLESINAQLAKSKIFFSNTCHKFNCYHRIDACNYSVLSFSEVFQNMFYRHEDTVNMIGRGLFKRTTC